MSFLENLNWRYATKKFDTTRKVSDLDVQKIIEAVRLTPTSYGLQPFHLYVISHQETLDKIQAAAWNQPQIGTASHLFVLVARTDLAANKEEFFTMLSGGDAEKRAQLAGYEAMMDAFIAGKPTPESVLPWSAKQVYLAEGFALAACAELEIDSCPMEGFSATAVAEILGLPDTEQAILMLPIGYREVGEIPRPKVRFSTDAICTIIQ